MKKSDFCSFPEFGIFKEAVSDDDSNAFFALLAMTWPEQLEEEDEEERPPSFNPPCQCRSARASKNVGASELARERQSAFPLSFWCSPLSDCICERPPR